MTALCPEFRVSGPCRDFGWLMEVGRGGASGPPAVPGTRRALGGWACLPAVLFSLTALRLTCRHPLEACTR